MICNFIFRKPIFIKYACVEKRLDADITAKANAKADFHYQLPTTILFCASERIFRNENSGTKKICCRSEKVVFFIHFYYSLRVRCSTMPQRVKLFFFAIEAPAL